ncbi:hypothetical protein AB0D29_00735 [Streptomyces sp. NPDC048424]
MARTSIRTNLAAVAVTGTPAPGTGVLAPAPSPVNSVVFAP